eukprot:GEMP01038897.1.p1 GENE.GEMP01038897.1~~GEMP01038897.1.p1  ORF type:complete len:254 (+),score=37.26 GEMP01038897.1:81-764(+)
MEDVEDAASVAADLQSAELPPVSSSVEEEPHVAIQQLLDHLTELKRQSMANRRQRRKEAAEVRRERKPIFMMENASPWRCGKLPYFQAVGVLPIKILTPREMINADRPARTYEKCDKEPFCPVRRCGFFTPVSYLHTPLPGVRSPSPSNLRPEKPPGSPNERSRPRTAPCFIAGSRTQAWRRMTPLSARFHPDSGRHADEIERIRPSTARETRKIFRGLRNTMYRTL